MTDTPKKTIFEYDDYREFLRDVLARRKQEDKKYSFRHFARLAGFQAHSFIILVLQGKTDISIESIEKFAKGLTLGKEEAFFFKNLVLLNQSKTAIEKQKYAKEILSSKSYRKQHPLSESQFSYLSQWYYPAIRELACLSDDPTWIAKKLSPNITPTEAKKALDHLLKLGLLILDPNGKLTQATPHVTSTDEVSSSHVVQAHQEYLRRASEALNLTPLKDREISAMTIGVKQETIQKVKEMIKRFRKEVVEVCSQDESVETVYQINFQLFPLIQTKDKGDS